MRIAIFGCIKVDSYQNNKYIHSSLHFKQYIFIPHNPLLSQAAR